MSVLGLEKALQRYLSDGNFETPFDLKQVPISAQPITSNEDKKSSLSVDEPVKKEEKKKSQQEIYAGDFAFRIVFFKIAINTVL